MIALNELDQARTRNFWQAAGIRATRPASPRFWKISNPGDPTTPGAGKAAATSGVNVTQAWHGWTRLCLPMESTENGSDRDSHGIRQQVILEDLHEMTVQLTRGM